MKKSIMNKKTIPCIEDKCLKFPICQNKSTIRCDKLFSYLMEPGGKRGSYDVGAILPHTLHVKKEKETTRPDTIIIIHRLSGKVSKIDKDITRKILDLLRDKMS